MLLPALFVLLCACAAPPGSRAPDAAAPDAGAPDTAAPPADRTLGDADTAPDRAGDLTAPPGRFHVRAGFLRDRHGRAVVMRGINLSNTHKSKPYLGWHRPADYRRASEQWGLSGLRFLVSWSGVEPQKGQYDDDYLDQVALRVGWARDAGLLVVLDFHQDVYGEGFGGNGAPKWTCDASLYASHVKKTPWFNNYSSPQVMTCFDRLYTTAELRRHYAAAWARVARRLRGLDNVVGFDVMNEPHWGTFSIFAFEAQRLRPFYDEVVRAVRAEAPGWVAVLEPANSSNMGFPTGIGRSPYANTLYAPHVYDGQAELGLGFDHKRRAAIVSRYAFLATEARALGSALWVGEYGGVASHPGIEAYMDANYDGAAAVAASTMYWEYGKGGYGPLAGDGSEHKGLLDALVRPYPARVAGDPLSYAYDETTRAFSVTYRPDPRVTAPTELVVPARVYPGPLSVTCTGCTWARLGQRVHLLTPPHGETTTVTVAPRP